MTQKTPKPQRVPTPDPDANRAAAGGLIFGQQQEPDSSRNWLPWVSAAAVVVVILGLILFVGGHASRSTPSASADASQVNPYAQFLELSDPRMSQAENFAGSQVTYIDGTITNHGTQIVTGVTVTATFSSDGGDQPQVETLPMLLIRTHEPYVDTEPISSEPLQPGQSHEFRLIFDDISPLWNQQVPHVEVDTVRLAASHP